MMMANTASNEVKLGHQSGQSRTPKTNEIPTINQLINAPQSTVCSSHSSQLTFRTIEFLEIILHLQRGDSSLTLSKLSIRLHINICEPRIPATTTWSLDANACTCWQMPMHPQGLPLATDKHLVCCRISCSNECPLADGFDARPIKTPAGSNSSHSSFRYHHGGDQRPHCHAAAHTRSRSGSDAQAIRDPWRRCWSYEPAPRIHLAHHYWHRRPTNGLAEVPEDVVMQTLFIVPCDSAWRPSASNKASTSR